jgi:hypothetical protein
MTANSVYVFTVDWVPNTRLVSRSDEKVNVATLFRDDYGRCHYNMADGSTGISEATFHRYQNEISFRRLWVDPNFELT